MRTTSSSITPTTDDTGAFRVWGLAPGDYLVGARPNRFVAELPADAESSRAGYATTYYPGTPSLSNARSVRVEPGRDTAGVSFGLVTVPLSAIRGTVLLPPDTPGRAINLGVGLVAPQRLDGYVTRGARARDDGSFELTRLAPGTYQVTARHFQQGGVEYYGTTDVDGDGHRPRRRGHRDAAGAIVRGRVVNESGEPVGRAGDGVAERRRRRARADAAARAHLFRWLVPPRRGVRRAARAGGRSAADSRRRGARHQRARAAGRHARRRGR